MTPTDTAGTCLEPGPRGMLRAVHLTPALAKRAGLQASCDAPLHITAKAVLDSESSRGIFGLKGCTGVPGTYLWGYLYV